MENLKIVMAISECTVGSIASSSGSYVTLDISPEQITQESPLITIVIDYEDPNGNIETYKQDVECKDVLRKQKQLQYVDFDIVETTVVDADEELLEIIDYYHKADYALQESSQTKDYKAEQKSNEDAQPLSGEMTEEKAIEKGKKFIHSAFQINTDDTIISVEYIPGDNDYVENAYGVDFGGVRSNENRVQPLAHRIK